MPFGDILALRLTSELADLRAECANPASVGLPERQVLNSLSPPQKEKTDPIGSVHSVAEREGFEPSNGY